QTGPHTVRDQEPQDHRETEGDQHPLKIIEYGKVEFLAVDQVGVVVEADKSFDGGHPIPLKKTQIDRVKDRVTDKSRKKQERHCHPKDRDERMVQREMNRVFIIPKSDFTHGKSFGFPTAAKSRSSRSPANLPHRRMLSGESEQDPLAMDYDFTAPRVRTASSSVTFIASSGEVASERTPCTSVRKRSEIAGATAWSTCIKVNEPESVMAFANRCSISLNLLVSASTVEGNGLSISSFFLVTSGETYQFRNSAAASLFLQ